MARVIDLRGQDVASAPAPVLADPSGRRARLFTRGGRVVALLFLLWFVGLALAGLGILPAGDVPLGRVVQQSPAPLAAALRTPSAAYRHATAGSLSAAAQRSLASRLHGQTAVGGTTAGHSRATARPPGSHSSAGNIGRA